MLLFLFHDNFHELPEQPAAHALGVAELRGDARALLFAGLVLSAWCVLRLLSASVESRNVDLVLALASLTLGVGAVLRSASVLRRLAFGAVRRSELRAGARAWDA